MWDQNLSRNLVFWGIHTVICSLTHCFLHYLRVLYHLWCSIKCFERSISLECICMTALSFTDSQSGWFIAVSSVMGGIWPVITVSYDCHQHLIVWLLWLADFMMLQSLNFSDKLARKCHDNLLLVKHLDASCTLF